MKMDFCTKRNIVYAFVLGICLASLVQAKMIFGSTQTSEVLLQGLCSIGIAGLMRGTWLLKLWASLLTVGIAYLVLVGGAGASFSSALRLMNYLLPFIVGITLSIGFSFYRQRERV